MNRLEQIKTNLSGLGTQVDQLYTNQEIIDLLKELQSALAHGVFEKTHAENLRERDILIHFEALAKEYGLDSSNEYQRFKANMSELGYTIGSFIKGMNGEKIARRALKLLSYDRGVQILYNIELEDEDAQAEYDAIVVAPYGIFVIEVKNWSNPMVISESGIIHNEGGDGITYDLPGRMSIKEALLREHLEELFPTNYNGMLLLSNEKAACTDNYHQIPVSFGGGISYEIKRYNKGCCNLSDQQINAIVERIRASHKEQRALCTVNCEEIINDYAILMCQIEEASIGAEERKSADDNYEVKARKQNSFWNRIKWNRVGEVAAAVALVVLPGIVSTAVYNLKK